jgi:hypothetical protein
MGAGRRVTKAIGRAHCAAAALAAVACAPAFACPLEVIGTWRLGTTSEAQPMLVTFGADGWANVVTVTGAGRPEDFDTLAQVRYQLVPRRDPQRIEFQTRRGNDLFPTGSSSWRITSYTDETFSSRRSDSEAGDQAAWSRVQTHRYFLTFATRDASTEREPATFVMWTTLDGRKPVYEALGVSKRDAVARFGRMPDELIQAFARESRRADETMMRIELSEAEYRRTHQVFEAWDALLARDVLGTDDPASQVLGLLDAAVQSVNRCGVKLRTTRDGAAASPARQPLELVREIRKINDRRHVPDKVFPFRWKPPAVES